MEKIMAYGLGAVILAVPVVVGYFYWKLYLRRVASHAIDEENHFSFCCHAPTARKYALSLRYKIHHTKNEHHYGMVFFLHITVDGEPVIEKVISAGYDTDHVKEIPEFTQTEYFSNRTRRGKSYHRSAAVNLAKLPKCRKGAEIAITGNVDPAPDTQVISLELFLC